MSEGVSNCGSAYVREGGCVRVCVYIYEGGRVCVCIYMREGGRPGVSEGVSTCGSE